MKKVKNKIIQFFFAILALCSSGLTTYVCNASTPGIKDPVSQKTDRLIIGDSLITVTQYLFPEDKYDNHLRTLHKDDSETIWTPSRNGLYRFDGSTVELFAAVDIHANGINEMSHDLNGNIWLWRSFMYRDHAIQNISVVEKETRAVISRDQVFSKYPEMHELQFFQIEQHSEFGLIFNSTDGRVFKVEERHNVNEIQLNQPTRFLGFLENGQWLGGIQLNGETHIQIFDQKGQSKSEPMLLENTSHIFHCFSEADWVVCLDRQDPYITLHKLSLSGGLQYLKEFQLPRHTGFFPNPPLFFRETDTHSEIMRFTGESLQRDRILSYVNEIFISSLLPSPTIKGKDRYWQATPSGLISIEFRPLHFQSILHNPNAPPISFRKIEYLDESTAIAGGYRGLYTVDLSNPNQPKAVGPEENLIDCMGNYIHTFNHSQKHSGDTYFGMAFLARHNISVGECKTTIDLKESGITDLWDMVHLWDTYYYLGTDNGVYLFDEETGEITRINLLTGRKGTFSGTVNRIKYWSEKEKLALCTSDGLILADLKTRDPRSPILNHLLKPRRNINDVLFLEDGSMLISTWDDGLMWLTYPGFEQIKHFTRNYLLKSNSTHNLTKDKRGRVWFSANQGLYMFDADKQIVRQYTELDGLMENEFNHLAQADPPNDKLPMIYGGINGLTLFYPEKFELYESLSGPNLFEVDILDRRGRIHSPDPDAIFDDGQYVLNISATSEQLSFHFPVARLKGKKELMYRDLNNGGYWRISGNNTIDADMLPAGKTEIQILLRFQDNSLYLVENPVLIQKSGSVISANKFLLGAGAIILLLVIWYYLWADKKVVGDQAAKKNNPGTGEDSEPFAETDQQLKISTSNYTLLSFIQKFDAIDNEALSFDASEADLRKKLELLFEDDEFLQSATVDMMAQRLNLSNRNLFRKVKAATGMTPNRYLSYKKLTASRKLIQENPELTISEISYRVGYDKTSYFSRLFKQRYGLTPGNYRESYYNLVEKK